MSVLGKEWKILASRDGDNLMQMLLRNRGIESENEIQKFLFPSKDDHFHDPFLMKDMKKAVARIGRAIETNERIMIFGDYDVDGITGTAILMRTLTKLGGTVSCRLPHRLEDGYGLRKKFIEEFERLGVQLVITVDNGVSCKNEVAYANEKGIDVIISDHHTLPQSLPDAYAILHPKLPGDRYPFTELTGAGVALKLAAALMLTRAPHLAAEIDHLLDLAAMGTVADLGVLVGENRYIVKEGLRILETSRWPGLSRLKEYAGIKGKLSTHDIGFLLCPRINAAGRISNPTQALKLLINDIPAQSEILAESLERLNRKRQTLMEELMEIAEPLAAPQKDSSIITLTHPRFHGGVIGLIAMRLVERFNRPAIAMEQRGTALVGSCRSLPGINIVELLSQAGHLLTNFGGHPGAAGFELPQEHLDTFIEAMKNALSEKKPLSQAPSLMIDCEISAQHLNHRTVEMLQHLAPFGIGNEVPRFLYKGLAVSKMQTVGRDKKHLKILGKTSVGPLGCIGFKLGQFLPQLQNRTHIDLVCELEKDNWNGGNTIQLKIIDVA